jgi:DNA-binding MarR family transcriptional regulator
MKDAYDAAVTSAHELRLYHRIQTTAHVLKKLADTVVAPTGLSTSQLAVLAIVGDQGPVLQRRVAAQLAINESAVTPMVQRLEAEGMVRRVEGSDRRSRALELTAAGRQASERAGALFASVNLAIDGALADPELRQLAGLLDRVRAAASAD